MNILLKSFDGDRYDKPVVERAFRGRKIRTCVSVADDRAYVPDIAADEHIWLPAGDLRNGRYPVTDWSTYAPIDEQLIEKMRGCEGIFMTMITRYAVTAEIPYKERKRQYYDHLRFWNHELTAKKIDLVLMNHPPHQCYDIVMYDLCKLKNIPLLYLERNHPVDAMFIVEDWEESATELRDRLTELRREFADPAKPVPLSPRYEEYLEFYRARQPRPWFKPEQEDPGKRSFFKKWAGAALRTLVKNPKRLFRSLLSPQSWAWKLNLHNALHFYNQNVRIPDLKQPYIYAPLHYQPEATTSPQAGAFVDQELIIQLLAASLPPGVNILVKEHPLQGELCRSKEFYQSLLDIPSVTFVPKEMDTYELMDHCVAIASAVGSAIFEGMLRGKPSIMFGHFFYQYAPGVHCVRTLEDCKRAVDAVLRGNAAASEHDIRLFLKATEETSSPFILKPDYDKYDQSDRAELMGAFIEKRVSKMFP